MAIRSGNAAGIRDIEGFQRTAMGIGAVYDGVLGVLFLVAAGPLMSALGVAAPENPIYLQLAAGLIAIMGLVQYFAWKNGQVADDTVIALVAFKALYVLLAFFAGFRGGLPHPVFGVFAAVDLAFLVIFLGILRSNGSKGGR